ncbi:MAG: hypothetical protein ACOZDY_16265 [Pseudomonadota bacterium]
MKPKTVLTMFGVGLLASMAVPALAEHPFENSFEKQRLMTDGYSEPAAVPASRLGAAGRPGKSTDDKSTNDAWLEKQLTLSDG